MTETPIYDAMPQPEHFPMPINRDGEGPEPDPDAVTDVICSWCQPVEVWPCAKSLQDDD